MNKMFKGNPSEKCNSKNRLMTVKKHKKLQTYARPFMQQCSMQKAQQRGTPSKPEYQGIDKLVKKRGFTQRATASYVQPIS